MEGEKKYFMGQKRFKRGKSRPQSLPGKPHSPKRHIALALENSILAYLYAAGEPASMTDIARTLSGKRTLSNEVKAAITHLLHIKAIIKSDKKRYELSKSAQLYTGTLQQHPKGFGFVSITGKHGNAPDLGRDAHVTANRLGPAIHGDTVLLRVLSVATGGRPEAAILKVIERGPDTVAGFFTTDKKGSFVFPEDTRYPFIIRVNAAKFPDLQSGTAVVVKVKVPAQPTRIADGIIIKVLGSPDNIDVQMRLVIEKFRLPHTFSPEAEQEAQNLPDTIDASDDREDLRRIQHVTIDGETAKDFDDAICVTRTDNGYRLHVSIADVSYFVKPGSALDRDAYERGTSIYFPGRVIPMLPEKLSNNLCSLIPGEDRLALTAILDFDPNGILQKKRFCRSIIVSHRRFTYTTVAAIVIEKNEVLRAAHQSFIEMLENAAELATLLQKLRKDRGSIGFSLPEPEISLDEGGRIAAITRADRNFAHQIIEEFMLSANEAVAETFTQSKRKSLYRIHELPNFEKVVEFSVFAKTLDLQLPPPETSPEWFGKVLDLCKGTPKEYIVNNLLLRTMQQAKYSAENVGHFALATTDYTHFTSPIRRYPDLMVHRELCRLLLERQKKVIVVKAQQDLQEQGTFLSARERTAVGSEREMNDRLKLIYMEKHLNEPFSAIISGVTEFAFFVELLDLFISGSVSLENLSNEYFLYDSKHHRVIGEITGKTFQLGDIITVTATDVDKNKNRINFKPSSLQ
jgi:ribonuclease R